MSEISVGQQFQQSAVKIHEGVQRGVQTAVKEYMNRRRQTQTGDNLADLFDDAAESPQRTVRPSSTSPSDSSPSKEKLASEFLAAKKPREIVEAMMMTSSDMNHSTLVNGVFEHFENIVLMMREIERGELEPPIVSKEGLGPLLQGSDGSEKLGTLMGGKVCLLAR